MSSLSKALQREEKIYKEFPNNWNSDIAPFIEQDMTSCKSLISGCIMNKEPIAFIDACSIIKLAAISTYEPLIEDMCSKYKVILLTGEVVKELSSETKKDGLVINPSDWVTEQVSVIRCFAKYRKLLYIHECDLCNHLLTHVGDRFLLERRSLTLIQNISKNKSQGSKIHILAEKDPIFARDFIKRNTSEPGFTNALVQFLKSKKKQGDSLAELLILIIINMFVIESMPKLYLISEDRRADLVYQNIISFQHKLRNKQAISENKFMGRIELIYFLKSCVINQTIVSDAEIIECCKPYLGSNQVYRTTISGGMYPEPETVLLNEKKLLNYMKNPHYNFHSTSNRNVNIINNWEVD